jgi:hypothetical protein
MGLRRRVSIWAVAGALAAGAAPAQLSRDAFGGSYGGPIVRTEGRAYVDEDTVRTARETAPNSTDTPEWTNPRGFEKDVFTFTRAIFKSEVNTGFAYGRGQRFGWWVDYPDADLNFSYRLQQLTSIKVDPDGRVIKLTDAQLRDYPFIYMEHTGYMRLMPAEVAALRSYLLNGGVLVVIDFWSTLEWEGFEQQMARVLPDRKWTELSLDHPIFHCVFELKGPMRRLQVPTMQLWDRSFDPDRPGTPLHWVFRGQGSEDMHVRAWMDDKDRPMIIALHNCDLSDGWEREGENDAYFHTFSEKISYPLGINIVFYLMTH